MPVPSLNSWSLCFNLSGVRINSSTPLPPVYGNNLFVYSSVVLSATTLCLHKQYVSIYVWCHTTPVDRFVLKNLHPENNKFGNQALCQPFPSRNPREGSPILIAPHFWGLQVVLGLLGLWPHVHSNLCSCLSVRLTRYLWWHLLPIPVMEAKLLLFGCLIASAKIFF